MLHSYQISGKAIQWLYVLTLELSRTLSLLSPHLPSGCQIQETKQKPCCMMETIKAFLVWKKLRSNAFKITSLLQNHSVASHGWTLGTAVGTVKLCLAPEELQAGSNPKMFIVTRLRNPPHRAEFPLRKEERLISIHSCGADPVAKNIPFALSERKRPGDP